MADDRLVTPQIKGEESAVEHALRPKTLNDFVGQKRVREQIDVLLTAARHRNSPADHILLSGPPGLGKTTLALILELKGKLTDLSTAQQYKGHQPAWREQLTSALVSLGFSPKESDGAISQVVSTLQADGTDAAQLDLSELLKLTLASGKSARG